MRNTLQHFLTVSSLRSCFHQEIRGNFSTGTVKCFQPTSGEYCTQCSILPSESNVDELGAVYDEVFIESGGHGHSSYGLPSDESYFVVVRPDGVVGARVHEVDGVERYFQKIFS